MPTRLALRLILGALLIPVSASPGFGEDFPSRAIKIIVPLAVGAPADIRSREIAARMTQQFGSPVIVENKPGAGATIGASFVARARPDGYTILYAFNGPMVLAPHALKHVGYDPLKDFAPIIRVGSQAMILAVPASAPHADLKSLVAWAKANPGKLLYGSSGIGSVGHLPAEMLKRAAGNLDIGHVPYKGDNEVVQDLVNQRFDFAFATPGTTLPQIKAGKLRALAVTSTERLAALPEVPTMQESGYADFLWVNWFGFVAPARTPQAIIDQLYGMFAAAANDPDYKARQEAQLVLNAADRPAVFAAWIKREHERIGKLVREIGLEVQ